MKKHYIKTQVPVEKKTLFGKKTVYEEKIVQVDETAWEKYRAVREQERLKKEKEEIFNRALREQERKIKEESAARALLEQERREKEEEEGFTLEEMIFYDELFDDDW